MIIIAALILPAAGLLLFGMDRIEEWLSRPSAASPAHPAPATKGRHLHLLPRPRRDGDPVPVPVPEPLESTQSAA